MTLREAIGLAKRNKRHDTNGKQFIFCFSAYPLELMSVIIIKVQRSTSARRFTCEIRERAVAVLNGHARISLIFSFSLKKSNDMGPVFLE